MELSVQRAKGKLRSFAKPEIGPMRFFPPHSLKAALCFGWRLKEGQSRAILQGQASHDACDNRTGIHFTTSAAGRQSY